MAEAMVEVASRLLRFIPDMRGKTRISRLVLRGLRGEGPVELTDRFGNRLMLPSAREPISEAIFGCGVYEHETIRAALLRLPPNGVFVDVGANIGAIALPMARLRRDARVVCVEASAEVAALLRANATRNALDNAIVVEAMVGPTSTDGVVFYPAPADRFGMGSIGPQFASAGVRLRQHRLDDVLDRLGIGAIHVVKMDVEGGELGTLQGLTCRLGAARPPAVIFEFNDWAENRVEGQSAGDAQRYLLTRGYRLFRLRHDGHRGAPLGEPLTSGSAALLAEHADGWCAT